MSDLLLLSVVIPLFNEAGNIAPLIDEIETAFKAYAPVGEKFEIVCVDDGSDDATAQQARACRQRSPHVRLILHTRRQGMSAALRTGIRAAKAPWILTLDGDRQNDPADAPRLCALAWNETPSPFDRKILVAGIRINRRDTLAKRLASRFANGVRRWLLRDSCPDTGCSLKLFRKDAYLSLPFFSGLHRFMPALFRLYGNEVAFLPVNDRPRLLGTTKSDFLGRGILGFFDLLGVLWLLRRTPAPVKVEEDHG